MNVRIRQLLVGALALVALVPIACNADQVITVSEGGGYRVTMPAHPSDIKQMTNSEQLGDILLHIKVAGVSGQGAAFVVYGNLPADLSEPTTVEKDESLDEGIRSFLTEMLKSAGADPVKDPKFEPVTTDGNSGKQIQWQTKLRDQPFNGVARAYLVKKRFYYVGLVGRPEFLASEKGKAFLSSFSFLSE
jgi:hypothetical protein